MPSAFQLTISSIQNHLSLILSNKSILNNRSIATPKTTKNNSNRTITPIQIQKHQQEGGARNSALKKKKTFFIKKKRKRWTKNTKKTTPFSSKDKNCQNKKFKKKIMMEI